MQEYLNLARQGKNEWWRYILSVLLILFMWQIVGSVPGIILFISLMASGSLQGIGSAIPGTNTLSGFVAFTLASVFFLGGIAIAMHFIHQRRMRSLITPDPSIAWGRVFQGFIIWFFLAALMSLIEALLYPGRYVFSLDVNRFIPFALSALILIPIQTSAEELFFRGFILQAAGLRIRNIWVLSIISGLLFGLPHLLNPEASINYPLLGLYYFSFGFSLAIITLWDGRLELALGAHAANNLFSVIFANYKISVLPSPSLFTINVLDAVYSVLAGLIGMGIFVFIFIYPWRRERLSDHKPSPPLP